MSPEEARAELAKRHKQEVKQASQDRNQKLQGKKGDERKKLELECAAALAQLNLRHLQEARELESRLDSAEETPAKETENEDEEDVEEDENGLSSESKKKLEKAKAKREKKRLAALAAAASLPTAAEANETLRATETKAIDELVGRLGLKVVAIPSDGDCMYTALTHQLATRFSEKVAVPTLRGMATKIMKKNPAMFEPYLPEEHNLDTYCEMTMRKGEWGGELELRALSMALQRPIWVYRARGPVVKMGQEEFGVDEDGEDVLTLTFHEHQFSLGEHYNSAVPV